MVLNNYWKWLQAATMYPITSSSNYCPCTFVDISGNSYSQVTTVIDAKLNDFSVGISARLGTGDNTITADDYCLTSDISSSVSNLICTIQSNVSNNGLNRMFTITGINSSNEEIEITEVGIQRIIYIDWGPGSDKLALLAVAKLSESVKVPVGEGFSIVLNWAEM